MNHGHNNNIYHSSHVLSACLMADTVMKALAHLILMSIQ